MTKNTTQTMCDEPARNKSFEYKMIPMTMMPAACATVATRVLYKFFAQAGFGLDNRPIWATAVIFAVLSAHPNHSRADAEDAQPVTPPILFGRQSSGNGRTSSGRGVSLVQWQQNYQKVSCHFPD